MKKKRRTQLWTTRAGERVRICDMTDDHLLNVVRHLRRMAEYHGLFSPLYDDLVAELRSRTLSLGGPGARDRVRHITLED